MLNIDDLRLAVRKINLEDYCDHVDENHFAIFPSEGDWFSASKIIESEEHPAGIEFCFALRMNVDPLANQQAFTYAIQSFLEEKFESRPSYCRIIEGEQVVDCFLYPCNFRKRVEKLIEDLRLSEADL